MSECELFDLDALAEAKETMKAKFPTMIQYFLEDSESYIAAVKASIEANNVEGIIAPSHTLKSSSRQIGAQRLSNIAKNIESLSREQASLGKGDVDLFRPLLKELEIAFAETKSGLLPDAA